MTTEILTVVTGSRLHGLNTPESDTDLRGIFCTPIQDILNPFQKPPETRWIEGESTDDMSFDLRRFAKDAVQADPNTLEILFSNMIHQSTPEGDILRAARDKFLDTDNIFARFVGYGNNQINKMHLYTPDKRTPKFAVAYMRTLLNGIQLLQTGATINPVPKVVTFSDGFEWNAFDDLWKVKFQDFNDFGQVRSEICDPMFARLNMEIQMAHAKATPRKPDIEWIRSFVNGMYNV